MMSMIIERATAADIEFVKQIEIECSLGSWSRADYLKELERADSLFFLAREQTGILGFVLARLIMKQKLDASNLRFPRNHKSEIEIYNIAVKNEYRHRKIGTKLLEKIFESAAEFNECKIHLEVRRSNSDAIKFYIKNGFEIIGNRKNFYTNPSEDAFLMSRTIKSAENA